MMGTLDDLRARIERTLAEMDAEAASAPAPGQEPRPDVRHALIAAARLRTAWRDEVSITRQLMVKGAARLLQAGDLRAVVLDKVADCEARAARAPEHSEEARAWTRAGRYLLSGEDHEVPGGVIALCRELHIGSLPSLPTIDDQLADAEARLAPHLARLRVALDTWDARATVHGDPTAVGGGCAVR